ncbi:MAG: 4-hydroxythreonine-4-phosphate dehydrogenase PdxA [Chloroflexi bacterium]|nr:4-hydroxythreonine-4-phosphate dehydrogenase PdxA [Chloroflexota bacterium]
MARETRGELPVLALTMGDPVGIGPEVVAKAVAAEEVRAACRPLVIGNAVILRRAAQQGRVALDVREVSAPDEPVERGDETGDVPRVAVLDPLGDQAPPLESLPLGNVSAAAGKASVEYVIHAIDLAMRRAAAGIVTAPINKEAINRAGFRYAGHTELLAERTGSREAAMMLVTGDFRVSHASTHVALERVPGLITEARLARVFELTWQTVRQLGIEHPKIAVAGLNPHASEHGLFGTQETDVIAPAIAAAQARGWDFSGPWPPDTIFARAQRGEFDAVVAMYHDQGHIAIKMIGFDEGVNLSLGLPIVRTSVDHGTAFDIAGKGVARPVSMIQATLMAAQLARARGIAPCGRACVQ